ncbi:pectinesterase-like [Andrographis paniculata]|uniref:pectinesterase-like n=1 Tax=Andrographis paniculata TaxID=175694 RepID=UPI0021E86AA0|nr:pectinesterase-like [Andrographis paniculata]
MVFIHHTKIKNIMIPNTRILFFVVSAAAAILLVAATTTTDRHYLSSLCHGALNPDTCRSFVYEAAASGAPPTPTALLKKMLINHLRYINSAASQTQKLKNQINGRRRRSGDLSDCLELFDLSNDLVLNSFHALEDQSAASRADARAWLSAALANHVTCFDGLRNSRRQILRPVLEEVISRNRAALAVLAATSPPDDEMIRLPTGEPLPWISPADRKLLQSAAGEVKADVTVAKDGSGKYKTVAEAVAAAPEKRTQRYVIRVKKGTYKEQVEIGKKKQNLMIIGDGAESTVITGDLNVADGSTTFRSATLSAVGEGFILQDITVQNTAGPEKHQAVALRVGADKSVINRCRIEAFQDTLYAHSLRQFYRECNITGTVDYIFGDAAAVFQKCAVVARRPMKGQKNMVTAQGRTDPNQNTGISIQGCKIVASEDLEAAKREFRTYLGRPWKNFSRTVVMESYVGDHVDPAGWSEWDGDFALKTLYYGEYLNGGPGAGTAGRVKWEGYHVITDPAEAMKFTVGELIQGGAWLDSTGVAYTEGL